VSFAGPTDPLRSVGASALLPAARAAAAEAGVTRLADVTRLDRIGLPVWQAIRPWSRALTVHQGKGATDTDAKLGALLEAVESHAAETFRGHGVRCPFTALHRRSRAPVIADFAASRATPPCADAPLHWVEAERVTGRDPLWVPFDCVSLDLTDNVPSLFDRASNGVATGATRDEARLAAIHELLERDSVTEWLTSDLADRMASTVRPRSVPFPWFHELRNRIEQAGARMRCFHVPSVTDTPVFACEINDSRKDARPFRAVNGRGAHPRPEIALFKAVAEAVQGRATYIAGARDDLYPQVYAETETAITVAFGFPLPPGMEGIDFLDVPAGPATLDELVAALTASGYPDIATITLARPQRLWVVRAFVCGLGSMTRRRRAPLQ
jgi:ribosomal protein S12 methylthiotransferase accessory factor